MTSARTFTTGTPAGPFTVVADPERDVILASGWTPDSDTLVPLIHPSIRPDSVRTATVPALREAVIAYHEGDLEAIGPIVVRQSSGQFLEHAWQVLRTVKAGAPVTYTEYAALSGRPAAVRGAASACARNAAALFVPCHRVIRTDGSLGGFRWGLPVKTWLLAHEASDR